MAYKLKNSLEERILKLLRSNLDRAFSAKELIQITNAGNQRYFYRVLQELIEHDHVFKRSGPGNSNLYTANKLLKNFKTLENSPLETVEIPRIDVHSSQLRKLLKSWSEEKWNPKIFHSAQYLPLGVARLYSQVAEVMYGSKVSKADLQEIRDSLELFRKDLIATCTTLFSIIETDDLWEPDTFFKFLMSEDAPPVDQIQDWVFKLKEKYQ